MERVALLVSLIAMASIASAEGTLVSWSPVSIDGLSREQFDAAKTRDGAAILELNLRASSWGECYEVLLGANAQREDESIVRGLVEQLSNRTETALRGTSQLIIWERIVSGEILFEGKGYQVEDDLFQVAGRANWVLRRVLEKNFGIVRANSTPEELEDLARRWQQHLSGQSPEQWRSPYENDAKGLSEVRSLVALEGLIVAMRPSQAKDAHIERCLKSVYKLDEMPSDPNAQPRMCIPDRWIYSYLRAITDVQEKQSAEWWTSWWEREHEGLVWNREEGRFATAKR